MTELTAIYFDLDGTLVDLYGVQNWEEQLNANNVTPYKFAAPRIDMHKLNEILEQFVDCGVTIGVISWLAMHSDKEYDKEVRKAKREWIKHYLPTATEIHVIPYGKPKHYACKCKENAVLVDDDANICYAWTRGDTILAKRKKDIIPALEKLLVETL